MIDRTQHSRFPRPTFFVWQVSILLALLSLGLTAHTTAQSFGESRLPILIIDASGSDIPDEPKLTTRMRLIYNGDGVVNRLDGPTQDYVGQVAIERRGSSSQDLFPKVGFSIELRANDGADSSASLLGMPREEDWVLHGPYSDKTLIRNAFTYTLARGLSTYAPRSRLVELVLGGRYWGVYLLVESIKRDKNRVDIKKLDVNDNAGDSLTGGYILKVDKSTGEDFGYQVDFRLPRRNLGGQSQTQLLYHYPKPADITAPQRSYIQTWMTEFERRLASPNFEDPQTGYEPLMDRESFIDFMLINELTRNVDGYRLSTYLYKERDSRGGRLHMGPVWDFNLAVANADYCRGSDVVGWAFQFEQYCGGDGFQAPFWFTRLWSSYKFRSATAARWNSLRTGDGALSNQRVFALFDSLFTEIEGDPAARNFSRWPVLGQYTWPNSYVPATHEAAYNYARNFLDQRLAWLDQQFARVTPIAEYTSPTNNDLRIYPNPGQPGQLQFSGIDAEDPPNWISWTDLAGRVQYSGPLKMPEVPGAPQRAGLYHYRITTHSGQRSEGWWISVGE